VTRRVCTPKADLVVGNIVEESLLVHIGAHANPSMRQELNWPSPEAIKAEPNIWAFTDGRPSAGAIFQLLPARPNLNQVRVPAVLNSRKAF